MRFMRSRRNCRNSNQRAAMSRNLPSNIDVAIIGAGPIGASIAHTLARRARVRDVRLIDAASTVAAGKALDIKQSGPVEGYDTRVSGDGDVLAAAGAGAIVIADSHESGEWEGERGLAVMKVTPQGGEVVSPAPRSFGPAT